MLRGPVLLLALGPLVACGSPASHASIMVDPAESAFDEPVRIVVAGLGAQAEVRVRAATPDAADRHWSADISATADEAGRLDLTTVGSESGSYTGVVPVGLISSMRAADAGPLTSYQWSSAPAVVDITAEVKGEVVARQQIRRASPVDHVTVRRLGVDDEGFVGTFATPTASPARKPAVLLLGGSEGGDGLALVAAALAAHQIPALSLAYFGAPGLPATADEIPLEYFRRPLRWLSGQPGVDPGRIWVAGASLGSSGAQLLALDPSNKVHGVVVLSGTNVVPFTPSQSRRCSTSPWSRAGHPVPYTCEWGNPAPTDQPKAVLPVDKFRGPVLWVCGEADQLWPSCASAHAALINRPASTTQLLTYPGAGHLVDTLLPYLPTNQPPPGSNLVGTSPEATDLAHADAWPRTLAFLDR